jgi:hypothetical protein
MIRIGTREHDAIPGSTADVIDNGTRFTSRLRRVCATELIFHESVTHDADACEWILQWRRDPETGVVRPRNLGVHIQVEASGTTRAYHDLLLDRLAHIGATHNDHSVAIEVTNIYYPSLRRLGAPWTEIIEAPWAHRGAYVVPTRAQLETVAALVEWLSGPRAPLPIPRVWPALDARRKRWRMGVVAGLGKAPTPGIYAHHHVGGHADAAFPVLYAWLRVEIGMDAGDAYAEALRLADGGGRWVSVAHLVR